RIGRNSMVGMNAVVMDEVVIGAECIIGALSFISANTNIPDRSLVVGNPGKIIKQVSDEMSGWKTMGTKLYQSLPADCYDSLISWEPLREMTDVRTEQERLYDTWEEIKKANK